MESYIEQSNIGQELINKIKQINNKTIIYGANHIEFRSYFDKYEKANIFLNNCLEEFKTTNKYFMIDISPMLKLEKNDKVSKKHIYKHFRYNYENGATDYYYGTSYQFMEKNKIPSCNDNDILEPIFENFTKIEYDIEQKEKYKIYWSVDCTSVISYY